VDTELHRGNVCVLKRALADFLCIVKQVEGKRVRVRYIDSPPDDDGIAVGVDEVIKLAEQQELELPENFLTAIERQRQVVFAPKKTQTERKTLGSALKGMSEDVYSQILQVLADDGKEDE